MKSYIIDTGNRYMSGMGKGYVHFKHGLGVLDIETLAAERPDWVEYDEKTKRFIMIAGISTEFYADHWKDRGVKVTECTEEEIKKVKLAIAKDGLIPKKFLAVDISTGESIAWGIVEEDDVNDKKGENPVSDEVPMTTTRRSKKS